MREEAADGNVVDRFPIAWAGVDGESVEIASVGLDGVRRGVALAQMAEEVIGGALDNGAANLGGGTTHVNLIIDQSSSNRSSSPSLLDDASHTHSSGGRALRACKSVSWKYRRGRGLFARCEGRLRSRPCESRRSDAACAGWSGVHSQGKLARLFARGAGGSGGGLLRREIKGPS